MGPTNENGERDKEKCDRRVGDGEKSSGTDREVEKVQNEMTGGEEEPQTQSKQKNKEKKRPKKW